MQPPILRSIIQGGKLSEVATIKDYLIVRQAEGWQVSAMSERIESDIENRRKRGIREK